MTSGDGGSQPFQLRPATDFEAVYDGQPPWDIDRPQPTFVALAESGLVAGRVLDVGCGTGEHALMAASRGLEAVGIDLSAAAIAKAEAKARDRGLPARFLVGDAVNLASLQPHFGGLFDTVLDCGLFHIFDNEDRGPYAEGLAAVTRPGGRHFLLCFNEHQPGVWGPRRTTQAEIRSTFTEAAGWRVDDIEPARLILTFLPDGVYAWQASFTRI